jgi:hypothetical protein
MASDRGPTVGYAVNVDAAHGPARQAYRLLHFAFTVAPILAGLDKFFDRMTEWDMYLAPWINNRVLHGHGHTFMLVAGVVEIVAGLGAAMWPRVFGWVIAVWMWGIIANLFIARGFYDVALRDFGLSLGAIALARLAEIYHQHPARAATTTTRAD